MTATRSFEGKKIAIIHFRVGKTDGVSIEIASWKEILTGAGAEVILVGGAESNNADFVIPHLENQLDPLVYKLDEEAFGGFKSMTEDEWAREFIQHQNDLSNSIGEALTQIDPDMVMVSNIFSVGENLAAAGAMAKVLDVIKKPTLIVNHDFYWENKRYGRPSGKLVAEQLDKYFPLDRPYARNMCINSIAKMALKKRRGIDAGILYDTFDFDQTISRDPEYKDLINKAGVNDGDIVVLQATRIVRRKNVELSIEFVRTLEEKMRRLGKVKLYDGWIFDPVKNRVVLLCSGYAEKRDTDYFEKLIKFAGELKIKMVCLNGIFVRGETGLTPILKVHQWADIVTYPSAYEGFGNQFLEAVYSKKPVVVFEYPVFQTDIGPKGFEVISLGDEVKYNPDTGLAMADKLTLTGATEMAVKILTDSEKYEKITERNMSLAKMHFSYEKTLNVFSENLLVPERKQEAYISKVVPAFV